LAVKIIGFSGSPIPDSNTDRAVKGVLNASGLEYEFIKLSEYNVRPCRARKQCVKDNICKVEDDFQKMAEKIKKAEALIIGAYSPYGSVDAWTKSLMERFWSLRHNTNLLGGKLAATVVSGCQPITSDSKQRGIDRSRSSAARVSEMLAREIRMERMELAGQVMIRGNVPCLTCGSGDTCEMSGVRSLRSKGIKASADLCVRVEEQKKVMDEVQRIGMYIQNRIMCS
jgi:hypothetical protein